MCIFQDWVVGFKPNNPKGMQIPIWIALKEVPSEFRNMGLVGSLLESRFFKGFKLTNWSFLTNGHVHFD
jgi:hypothetical protein